MVGVGTLCSWCCSCSLCTTKKTLPKNVVGNRSDVAWNHGVPIDGDIKKIQCKYCQKVIQSGGVYRLKHHLAGTQKDVGACRAVPEDVKKEMLIIVTNLQQNLIKKTNKEVDWRMRFWRLMSKEKARLRKKKMGTYLRRGLEDEILVHNPALMLC